MEKTATVFLLIFLHWIQGAPQPSAERRSEYAINSLTPQTTNPFSQEDLSLLKNYLKNVKEVNKNPDHMTREQVLLHLFALHDYDKSGRLDGLELMNLLMDFLSQNSSGQQSSELVTPMVDDLLEKQDSNMDGLLNLSELLTSAGEQSSLTGESQQHKVSQNAVHQGSEVTDLSKDLQERGADFEGVPQDQDGIEFTESLNEQHKTDAEQASQDALQQGSDVAELSQNPLVQGIEEPDSQDFQNPVDTEQHLDVQPVHHGQSEM